VQRPLSSKTLEEIRSESGLTNAAQIVSAAAARADDRFRVALAVVDIWRALATDGLPRRDQVDPLRFGAALLPYLTLIDVLEDGSDYRWRLFGGRHEQEYGISLVGVTVSDLRTRNPSVDNFVTLLDAARGATEPTFFDLAYHSRAVTVRHCCGALLPLSDDGARITHLLGCADWAEPDRRRREPG